jgi:hypothetical protein
MEQSVKETIKLLHKFQMISCIIIVVGDSLIAAAIFYTYVKKVSHLSQKSFHLLMYSIIIAAGVFMTIAMVVMFSASGKFIESS